MKLDEFKEEIYKCSGCGLCQSVCPVYKILKQECAVSRGKFKLLNAIVNREIGFSKKTLEIMDMCLHCQACSEFCPSGIDAQKIIEAAQSDMLDLNIRNNFKVFLSRIFKQKPLLFLGSFFISLVRSSFILDFMASLGIKKAELCRDFLKRKVRPLRKKSNLKKEIKAIFFKGCINTYLNSSSANAVYKIFDKTKVEVIDCEFSCCGLPMKSSGDEKSFIQLAKNNLDKLPEDFDYLIFDCQSCKSTFLEYVRVLEGDYKQKALNISQKCISVYGLLEKINYLPKKQWKHSTVTVHYPCHTRFSEDEKIMRNLLEKIPNITFIEAENSKECCGAAGSFILLNNDLSKQISRKKAQGIIKTGANMVVTSCPSCFLGIKQGLLQEQSSIKVMQLIEFLAQ